MKKRIVNLLYIVAGALLVPAAGMAGPWQAVSPSSQAVRPLGTVTQIAQGQLTLRTDAGPSLTVHLPEGVSVLRIPPGAKSLKSATKIAVNDINTGDRILVLGPVSPDQKSVLAKSVIVISKAALAQAREKERLDWEQRGISGVVKSINSANEQFVLAVPNAQPTLEHPTHLVTVTLKPHADLLRYAPDSVKFSDARRAPFSEIKLGDQVRALGDKSANGARFAAEKVVSGTFRNIGATVISVDAARDTITVKDLATGKPLLVRIDANAQMHQLPPRLASMIATFNSHNAAGNGGNGPSPQGPGEHHPGVEGKWASGDSGKRTAQWKGGRAGEPAHMERSFQQVLERTPPLKLQELKRGEPLIVVSTAGANPSEVTAIAVLSGVEPILSARPKGSKSVGLGPWNMSMGGSGGAGGGEVGP